MFFSQKSKATFKESPFTLPVQIPFFKDNKKRIESN